MRSHLRKCALGTLVVTGLVAGAAGAARANGPALTINGELGGGSVLSADQRNELGYGTAIQGSLRPGLVLIDPLMLQLAVSTWWFPSSRGYGSSTLLGGGLRLEPSVGDKGRFVIDGHAGLGRTGSLSRFSFDAGLGFEWSLSSSVGLGPTLRYAQTHATSGDGTADAKYWSLALAVTLRMPPPPPVAPPAPEPAPTPPPPPTPVKAADRDKDGIPDASDACPDQPAGPHPDPRPDRRGCPAVDTDKDGITDDMDKCPLEAQGPFPDPDRPGCPDGDDDHDGVYNREDQCRHEPAGLTPDPERKGCPAPDRDHDTIPDASDACPDKPGAPNADPKKNGCPGLVLIDNGQIKINKPVFFATNKDTILKKSTSVLNAVGFALTHNPNIRKVLVEGHTDNKGMPDKNLDLSQRRADSVKAWLIQLGVEAERLDSKGFGDTRPLIPNATSRGRAANRRVQFMITDPVTAGATP